MKNNLLVAVLGNPDSGKSYTWNTLFGSTVKTGSYVRRLYLTKTQWIEVFLVSGSPEERDTYVGEILKGQAPRIVLCSMQYRQDVVKTIQYFVERDYFLFVHWLNPGHGEAAAAPDTLKIVPRILAEESLLGVRDGNAGADDRVQEMRDFMLGWAGSRALLYP